MGELPWAVTRRTAGTAAGQRHIAAGICGRLRHQRLAVELPENAVRRVLSPAELLPYVETTQHQELSAIRSLHVLRRRWMDASLVWGPVGSVAFTLASGFPAATSLSDLDLVIYAAEPGSFPRSLARSLASDITDLPGRADVRVETPYCGFSLLEYACTGAASMPMSIMLRTANGAVLGENPWDESLMQCLPASPAPAVPSLQ